MGRRCGHAGLVGTGGRVRPRARCRAGRGFVRGAAVAVGRWAGRGSTGLCQGERHGDGEVCVGGRSGRSQSVHACREMADHPAGQFLVPLRCALRRQTHLLLGRGTATEKARGVLVDGPTGQCDPHLSGSRPLRPYMGAHAEVVPAKCDRRGERPATRVLPGQFKYRWFHHGSRHRLRIHRLPPCRTWSSASQRGRATHRGAAFPTMRTASGEPRVPKGVLCLSLSGSGLRRGRRCSHVRSAELSSGAMPASPHGARRGTGTWIESHPTLRWGDWRDCAASWPRATGRCRTDLGPLPGAACLRDAEQLGIALRAMEPELRRERMMRLELQRQAEQRQHEDRRR